MTTSIPVIVQGNSFSLAMPLQIYTIDDGEMVLQDYTPDPTDEISVQLKGSRRNYTYTPTIEDNIAKIDLTGNEAADNYAVIISVVKADGKRLRSHRTDQFFIVESSDDLTVDDIIEGLEDNVIYLDTQPFLAGKDGRGIVEITKTSTAGFVDTYTITYTDNTTSSFEVVNGGAPVIDNLTTQSSTSALSAGMGKALNDRLVVAEDAIKSDVAYDRTVVNGRYIVIYPSSDRGNIGSVPNSFLHIYTGLTAGSQIKVKFTGTNTTSGALAAAWYPTDDVSQMSKDNYSLVTEIGATYLKDVIGQTFTVTVPVGAPTLVLGAAIDADTQVTAEDLVGGKITDLDSSVADHEARIDVLENATAGDVAYNRTSLTNRYIVREPSSDRGNIGSVGNAFLHIYTGLTAGSEIKITFTGTNSTSIAQAAGWYTTDDVAQMSKSNFTAVSGLDNYLKNVMNQTFTVTVPAGAPTLVLSAAIDADTQVTAEDLAGGKITDLENRVEVLEQGSASHYKMQVARNDKDVYVAYNRGDGIEMMYWFGRVFTSSNNILGLRAVGYRYVNRANPDATWNIAEITTLCNQTGSDMIAGAIHINGVAVGGSHLYPDNEDPDATPTAVNQSWTIEVNGEELLDGEVVNCSRVKVTALNRLMVSATGWGNVLEEIIVMDVYGDSLDVEVSHNYKYEGAVGKYIERYYGMQSNGFGDRNTNLISTVAGQYPNGVLQKDFVWSTFTKTAYPNFCEFIARKTDGWKQMMQLDTTAYDVTDSFTYIGDHKWLGDTCTIGVAAGGSVNKLYHVLVYQDAKVQITAGMKYFWKGTYRWFK